MPDDLNPQFHVFFVLGFVIKARFRKCISHAPHQIDLGRTRQVVVDFLKQAMVTDYAMKTDDRVLIRPFSETPIPLDEFGGDRVL
jgi:hypothetical protein